MTEPNPLKVLENSVLIADKREVQAAIDRLASLINNYYGDRPIILLVVMTGAIMPAAWLASRLKMPLQMDFIHATRYSGQTEGGEIDFRVPPRLNLQNHDVLIVDDIYDIGLTLQMIEHYCVSRGASSVNSAQKAITSGRRSRNASARSISVATPNPRVSSHTHAPTTGTPR